MKSAWMNPQTSRLANFLTLVVSLIALTTMASIIYAQENEDPFGTPPSNLGTETKPADGSATKSTPDAAEGSTTQGSAAKQGSATQGSTRSDSGSTSKAANGDSTPFEERFWRYLSANNYKNWAPIPGKSGDFAPGKSPHGELVKMYLNRTAAGATNELPVGSVIIKENYGSDESLKAITIMYKSKGFNPNAGDWYWAKYNPDGTIAVMGEGAEANKIAGRFKACIECHEGAGGDDFVFFND